MEWAYQQGKMEELLPTLPKNSVDLILMDFPYSSLEKHRAVGTTTRLMHSWFPTMKDEVYPEVMRELFRVLAPRRHAYFFTNFDHLPIIKKAAEAAGFYTWKILIWDKQTIGMGYHYRNQHEFVILSTKSQELRDEEIEKQQEVILFAEKKWKQRATRQLNNLAVGDVLRFSMVTPHHRKYPTEKPLPLLQLLVEQSTRPGEIVLDACVGSGNTIYAANKAGRKAIGFDINPKVEPLVLQEMQARGKADDRADVLDLAIKRTEKQCVYE